MQASIHLPISTLGEIKTGERGESTISVVLGIDTGGTYTDAVLLDDKHGVLGKAKALTTKFDLSVGIRGALEALLTDPPPEIIAVSLSTTLATNAVVEGQGSSICLILIGYDPYVLRDAGLERILNHEDIVFIQGGHTPHGEEQAPLDIDKARQAILAYKSRVAAFAISGYFGVRNPTHELQVQRLVREITTLPVTCGHELTTRLHAPYRALTVALNARLIPLLQQLIIAVQDTLAYLGILAPLMVVKGDGSLINARMALERPLETILSGPAASVIGARHLTNADNVFVVDMGGTTTDIAALRGGQPVLNLNGAWVGGWQTMVEAIDDRTIGLGGDSEVRIDEDGELCVGPRRVIPLSLLAQDYPTVVDVLQRQDKDSMGSCAADQYLGRFIMRQRPLENERNNLTLTQREIWEILSDGPAPLSQILGSVKYPPLYHRLIDEMIGRGLIVASAFTPTDAVHVLGQYECGSLEAAKLGAALWATQLNADVEQFCESVVIRVVEELGRAVIASALAEEGGLTLSSQDQVGRLLVDRALAADDKGIISVAVSIKRPLVAIGAPVATYLPAVASKLGMNLHIPEHSEVASAVGAVAGEIVQIVRILIRPLNGATVYRVHLPSEPRDFPRLEEAVVCAQDASRQLAMDRANRAGASVVDVQIERHDRTIKGGGGWLEEIYLETEVIATAFGRMPLAV
jgi:N-methylhydantoinase A/oxoprolinase/acetone carboxylase beta subunit